MDSQNTHPMFFETLSRSLENLISEITEMKNLFLNQLDFITSNSVKIEELVGSFHNRLGKIESNLDSSENAQQEKTPNSKIKKRKLKKEIAELQVRIKLLTEENVNLRKIKQSSRSPRKIPDFEISPSENSLSSIQLLDVSDQRKLNKKPKKIREFRLDSAQSQSLKPNSSLLNDPRVLKVIESGDFSSIMAKEQNQIRSHRITEIQKELIESNQLSFIGKTNASHENSDDMGKKQETASTNNMINKKSAKSFSILNKKPIKISIQAAPKKEEIILVENQNSKSQGLSLKGIKNFSDFQNLLLKMKNAIHFSTYSFFSSDVDKNVECLRAIFIKYEELSEKIDQLEKEIIFAEKGDSCKNPELLKEEQSDEKFPQCSLNTDPTQNLQGRDQSILPDLQKLRGKFDIKTFQEKIMEIENNPSQLESFVYFLKAECESNWKSYYELLEKASQMLLEKKQKIKFAH